MRACVSRRVWPQAYRGRVAWSKGVESLVEEVAVGQLGRAARVHVVRERRAAEVQLASVDARDERQARARGGAALPPLRVVVRSGHLRL